MCSGLFVAGRAIAVNPHASAAIAISSTLSSVSVPCSQSSSTQSKPNAPIISTICGDGIITDTPNAGSPAASLAFMRLGFISAVALRKLGSPDPLRWFVGNSRSRPSKRERRKNSSVAAVITGSMPSSRITSLTCTISW
jgi:hypothetical protein